MLLTLLMAHHACGGGRAFCLQNHDGHAEYCEGALPEAVSAGCHQCVNDALLAPVACAHLQCGDDELRRGDAGRCADDFVWSTRYVSY